MVACLSRQASLKTVPSLQKPVPPAVAVAKMHSEALSVPTVEQQLKALRSEGPSPSPVEEDTGVAAAAAAAMFPAIKSADLPVFIGTSSSASAAAASVPSVISTVAPTFEPSFSSLPFSARRARCACLHAQ